MISFNKNLSLADLYLLKKNPLTEAEKDKETEETSEAKDDSQKKVGLWGNGEQDNKPQTVTELKDALDELDTISFSNEEDGTYTEQIAYKAELANELEVAKLDDKKKANRFYDLFNDRIKYDKDDLKIGIEYSIKQIEDEAVQKDLLKQLATIRKAEKDDKVDELEPTLDIVS